MNHSLFVALQMEWESCKVDNDYLICKEFPYQIKREKTDYIITERENQKSKYIQVKMNDKLYYKHIIIARQWIENDDPEHKTQVDHKNRNRADYHISNLRWVEPRVNYLNRGGWGHVRFEYVDELPDDVVSIILYKEWEFEGYFIDRDENIWFYNGEQYRKLHVSKENKVDMWDINHISHHIGVRGLINEFL